MAEQHTPTHNPWANTRIHVLGPQRKKPKAGDRRETKKHGVQITEIHVPGSALATSSNDGS